MTTYSVRGLRRIVGYVNKEYNNALVLKSCDPRHSLLVGKHALCQACPRHAIVPHDLLTIN